MTARAGSSSLDVVVLGLSLSSSWGNGHATTYRGLLRELAARGHRVRFLERDLPFYADNRDLPAPDFCELHLYGTYEELVARWSDAIAHADLVVVGSYVPEGIRVGALVTSLASGVRAFYDIDTPVTLAHLENGTCEYLSADLIPRYDLYLSFTGGPTLDTLERRWGSPRARPLYCSVDPALYYPDDTDDVHHGALAWDLGYLGTYSPDRQPTLDALLVEPARRDPGLRCVVAGPQYPGSLTWPANVTRRDHVDPSQHRSFYNAQRATLNVTRADMIRAGYSPSVRLFEAAACGVPIVSDSWDGLSTFFRPGEEILLAQSAADTRAHLAALTPERRAVIGAAARARVLSEHTAAHRAETLERYVHEHGRLGRAAAAAAASSGTSPSSPPSHVATHQPRG